MKALGLWLLGVLLLYVEIYMTGALAGIIGGCAIIAGVALAFWEHGPLAGAGLSAFSLVAGALLLKLGARTLTLERGLDAQEGFVGVDDHTALIGQSGTAATTLRPAGYAMIGGRRVDVVTLGELIEAGTPIEVMDVEGNRVIVRKKP